MSRVVHFEFPSSDLAASQKFYENVFGWKVQKTDLPMEYWLITTGPRDAPGIDGAIGGLANDLKGTVNTVSVDDLDDALQKVAANGGTVIQPKDVIPTVGYIAYVREPGGNVLGILQMFPESGM